METIFGKEGGGGGGYDLYCSQPDGDGNVLPSLSGCVKMLCTG